MYPTNSKTDYRIHVRTFIAFVFFSSLHLYEGYKSISTWTHFEAAHSLVPFCDWLNRTSLTPDTARSQSQTHTEQVGASKYSTVQVKTGPATNW